MEFDLIEFIKSNVTYDDSVSIGINDDAAILNTSSNEQLVVSTDTLVDGVHFDEQLNAFDIGYKSLAVNLSDLAAMGASSKWFTLNLTLPKIDMIWIEAFCKGLFELANKYKVLLVGGDTTQGPLSITITAMGTVKKDQYLTRNKASKAELIAVSGQLGSASFGRANPNSILSKHLKQPEPRFDISEHIKSFATTCIDLSDGLYSDLGHICKQSKVGARISLEMLPAEKEVKNDPQWINHALSGGDDYQLCFTFPAKQLNLLPEDCTVIGEIECGNQVNIYSDNQRIEYNQKGFVHFSKIN